MRFAVGVSFTKADACYISKELQSSLWHRASPDLALAPTNSIETSDVVFRLMDNEDIIRAYGSSFSRLSVCDRGVKPITITFNRENWELGVPAFSSVDAYRRYLVNHEIGHALGMDHLEPNGASRDMPVMFQQTPGIPRGMRANSVPLPYEIELLKKKLK